MFLYDKIPIKVLQLERVLNTYMYCGFINVHQKLIFMNLIFGKDQQNK